jgi:hypothetical protein
MVGFLRGLVCGYVALAASTQILLAQQCTNPEPPPTLSDSNQKTVIITNKQNILNLADFSLGRTLGKILETALPGSDTPANREGLLDSMLASFKATSLTNEDSGLTFTLSPRPGESNLTAKELLDTTPNAPHAMHAVGVFNRLDLAPASYQNCGEYRIVYTKQTSGFNDRMTLIFEAALPNPDPNGSPSGCRPVVELWKTFATKSDQDIAKALDGFYYAGGELTAGGQKYEPVVHFAHYGSPSGQVRANAFVKPGPLPWHLRQWKAVRDSNGAVTFSAVPLNENAAPGFYSGSAAGISPIDVFNQRKGFFQSEFVRSYVAQLTATDTSFAVARTNGGETNLIGSIGVDVDDAFYTPDSAASPSDDPAKLVQDTNFLAAIDKQLTDSKLAGLCGLTSKHILNRVGAMSCGGCHQFSNGAEVAPQILWPTSLNFVQIDEKANLSNLLVQRFLPQRKSIADKFLTDVPANSPARTLLDRSRVAAAGTLRAQLARFAKVENTQQVIEFAETQRALTIARKQEQKEPGAFVLVRRTH